MTQVEEHLFVIPKEIATEDETEHEDEQANSQNDDIDVEGEVVDLFRRHLAVGVGTQQSYTTQTS